jgi:hypothetical protein
MAKKTSAKGRRATGKVAGRGAARASARRTAKANVDPLAGGARKVARFLGMDPDEVAGAAEKLRAQTNKAGKRMKEEVGRLGARADELTDRFDENQKQGVRKVVAVGDEMARGLGIKPEELAGRVEASLDRIGKEAARMAEEANLEVRKMYDQAKERLTEILHKSRKP